MASERTPSIDPFADDIVNDPRHVDYSVKGLNESIAARIIAGVEALQAPEKSASGRCTSKATIVFSPRAGFGKSHLIGAVFRSLSGRATLVNVRPFGDPATCWKSILDRIVQELDFPDRYAQAAGDRATQLELFAHGVLSRIVANDLETGGGSESVIEILRRPVSKLTGLKSSKKWRQYVDKAIVDGRWLGRVEGQLKAAGIRLNTPLPTWLRVLHSYAYHDDDWERRRSCIDWIQADSIEDPLAEAIGIRLADRVSSEQTAGELNNLAKARVLDLCRLSRFFRPFLICFDQTETYGTSPDLARSLGAVVMDLVDEACNHFTVITANMDPWEKLLRPNWQEANLNRLAQPYLTLEGISQQQGRELAEHRLESFEVNRANRDRFWGNGRWLEELFDQRKEISVREFLHACSRRWAAELTASVAELPPSSERVSLAMLFKKYFDSISAKPRRIVFDRDTFHWLVRELAAGRDDLEVDAVTGSNGAGSPRWRYAGREFVFGFESGSHWKRWQKIARSAMAKSNRVFVCFRTPELPSIPKATWNVAKPDIDNARRSNLLILELSRHELVTLYAAHELYADALQGDIDWSADDVAAFLREQLADFWRRVLEWPGHPGPKASPASRDTGAGPPQPPRKRKRPSKPRSSGQATDELSKRVAEVTQKRRFLSLEELMDSLPQAPERETVLGICGEIPNIKVYTHPNMTMLQWQSS
jgi:hypothetical protein